MTLASSGGAATTRLRGQRLTHAGRWHEALPLRRNPLAIRQGFLRRAKPELFTLRTRDETGHLLRTQRVSTALDCHGDFATEYPGQIWYRC